MDKKFTLSDIESFLETRLNTTWVNRTIFDHHLQGYKTAKITDFNGETYMFKLRRKGKDVYRDILVSEDDFVLYKIKGTFGFEKNISKEWKKYISFYKEL
ncbi:MAG: hypothetical protein IKA36_06675 [Clostridia bacterium]|nr:hypothetical protein [Clostridia bacterium]